MSLKKVGVLFGGKSGEHDVSILSASSVLRAIDKSKYLPVPIGIRKNGSLASYSGTQSMLPKDLSHLVDKDFPYTDFSIGLSNNDKLLDVIFPILHGPNGEDGTIQGCLELMDIPYVGSGVLGSSTGMDKDIMKRVFESHGLPQVPYYSFKRFLWEQDPSRVIDAIEGLIPYPHFVKPANMGSSVGVHKAHHREELVDGIRDALKYDHKIIVEKGIDAREIEVAILGNEEPKASVPGEILPSKEFYDYEAKYLSNDSDLIIPARLSLSEEIIIKDLGVQAFLALDCVGLARADFFIDKSNNKIYINEVNTIPGFTQISMYPKLWEASGLSYSELIDQLIALAIDRHKNKVQTIV